MKQIKELAEQFEGQIKETVAKRFVVDPAKLSLMLNDKDGAYLSEVEPNTFCCFVVGQNGFLYLVAANLEEGGESLSNFKTDVIS